MKLIVNVVKTGAHAYDFVLENGNVIGKVHRDMFKEGLYEYYRGIYGAGRGMTKECAFAHIKENINDFFNEYGIEVQYVEK